MQVLVAYSSKHGSTAEIAQAIGKQLASHGFTVAVRDVATHPDLAKYDAVVLGSAVYAGAWQKPAIDYLTGQIGTLKTKPLWLFSSGPVGDPLKPKPEDAVKLPKAAADAQAIAHMIFAGRVEKAALNFGERALVAALRVPEGDYRDWAAIAAWADEVAASLEKISTG